MNTSYGATTPFWNSNGFQLSDAEEWIDSVVSDLREQPSNPEISTENQQGNTPTKRKKTVKAPNEHQNVDSQKSQNILMSPRK